MVRKIKNKEKTSAFQNKLKELKRNTNIQECLLKDDDTFSCEGKIVAAHSIQNNRFLKKISKNGNIFHLDAFLTNEDDLIFDFCEQGRKKFSTFKGFCKKHDKIIFSPIEDYKYINSLEQNFLFAFRALAKELHHQKENVKFYEKLNKKALEENNLMLSLQVTNFYKNSKTNFTAHLSDFEEFKNGIKLKKYDSLYTKVIEFDREYPIVCNSSFIPYYSCDFKFILQKNYNQIQRGEINPLIFFNVFPENGKTYILISCFKKYKQMLEAFFQSINGTNIKEKVSMLILTYAGNTGYSPDYIKDKFTDNDKENISKIFTKPLINALNVEKSYINLFRD